jgi:uncharacterized protein (TIGR00369 family)
MGLKHLPSHKSCYGCSPNNPYGLKLQFYEQGGIIKADFIPNQTHAGYQGLVHGGIISCLLDEVMGIAAGYGEERKCFAAELVVRFLEPLPLGKRVVILGERVADKKRLWLTKGEIRDGEGKIYAWGKGKYLPLSPSKRSKIEQRLNIKLTP